MAATLTKIFIACCIAMSFCGTLWTSAVEVNNNYLDVETPNFFNYNSPLRQPGSLRSRPYYDFLSTLYRRDATKSDLFRPYVRTRRDVLPAQDSADELSPIAAAVEQSADVAPARARRAIIFRPLFVYKQQQVKKQELAKRRRRH